MSITPDQLSEMKNIITDISNNSIKKLNFIIETELKSVAEKYNITPDRLVILSHPLSGNEVIRYEIGIKICGFTISNEFTIKS